MILGEKMKSKRQFKETSFYALLISFALMLLEGFIYTIIYTSLNNEPYAELITYVLLIVLFFLIWKKEIIKSFKSLKDDLKGKTENIFIVYLILYSLILISSFILYKALGGIASNEEIARASLLKSPVIMFISLAILAPITEEFIFRFPYRKAKTNKLLKFFIYTLAFASLHIITSTSLSGLLYIIPYFFLSASIGYSYYKTDNILTSIFFHVLNNTITVLIVLIGG